MLESALKWDELIWDKWGGLGFKLGLARIGCDGLLIGEHFLKCNLTASLIHLEKEIWTIAMFLQWYFKSWGQRFLLLAQLMDFQQWPQTKYVSTCSELWKKVVLVKSAWIDIWLRAAQRYFLTYFVDDPLANGFSNCVLRQFYVKQAPWCVPWKVYSEKINLRSW